MPKFDFTPQPVQMPNAVQIQESSAPIQIQQQSRNQLSGAVDALGGAYQGMLEEQDNADMANAYSAIDMLKTEEDIELSKTVNPADIKIIQEKYKTQYDNIIGGKEPLNNKPYFRNQSGKDKFNRNYMQKFNTQRYAQGRQREVELNRRDSEAKLTRAIKAVPTQAGWDTPLANKKIDEYIGQMEANGMLTREQAITKKQEAYIDLDVERSNRMFADIEMVEYKDDGAELQKLVDNFKFKVANLDNLDKDEKNAYYKKADALFKRQKAVADVTKREAKADKKLAELDINGKVALGIADGSIKIADAIKMDGISDEYKISLYNQFNKQTAEAKKRDIEKFDSLVAQQQAMKSKLVAQEIDYKVHNYDPTKDRLDGYKMRTSLQKNILANESLSATQKSYYQGILLNGLPLDEEAKLELQSMENDLTFELGIGVELDKKGMLSTTDKQRGFKKEVIEGEGFFDGDTITGDVIKDGLNSAKRMEIYSHYMGRVRELFKRGKIDEARDLFKETKTALQKHDDDTTFYQKYSDNKAFVRQGLK